ncbi:hypothetical protein Bpfe_022029 [Biomphalaria pfeifferi]|uniref:Uncharacterized protein n=1 Tax=Biomphalaria pfeifferi TaxID=112525 RepID=A0AAD8B5V7_BIOPF|nr:hypothetical protein Bpfe_022029 [Biomphalaria pfeifferi]
MFRVDIGGHLIDKMMIVDTCDHLIDMIMIVNTVDHLMIMKSLPTIITAPSIIQVWKAVSETGKSMNTRSVDLDMPDRLSRGVNNQDMRLSLDTVIR